MPLRRIALAAVVLAGAALPAAALDLSALSEAEREAFRAEVRAYLLENPEVLMEAIAVLESREAAAQEQADRQAVTENLQAIENDGISWVGGNPEGDVTLVEFMDYRCGYCRRAFETVEELVEGDGNIRFVLKEFPILGPQSELASRFAIAVHQIHGDDAYKDVHDALMTFQGDITPEALGRLAEALALDPEPVLARMDAPEVTAIIAQNRALANRLGITGTPTFVLGGRMVRGFVPLEAMEALVEQARSEG
ncbi:Protein-disulfide isomerase [Rubellimicrobium thermophilum DSM 16684]|uniref:Protein-disulfide isomerase n=1 Tax=Rubellimicrobium thermophilum DSM 16684 TaxID=1123069 RepID=S9SHI3_9RHOB|nr:DsbA family protein [Rubellimicrobium thermophilum]EPX85774.1 Protein-disulfide isomerase [Rubellimicrobium thermophilum DSM 16684]